MNNKFIMLNFCSNVHRMVFLSLFLTLFIFCSTKADGAVIKGYPVGEDSLEMTIDGDGLFILKDTNDNVFYSRYGAFYPDNEGYLVNSSGYRLQGYTISPHIGLHGNFTA
jgi:hypothetical protein